MTEHPEDERQYWHSNTAALRNLAKGIAMAGLGLGVVAIMIFWSDGIAVWMRVLFGLVMLIPVGKGMGGISTGIGMLTSEGRLAVAVSPQGIRAPGIGLTPWERIESIHVFSGMRSASWRSAIGGMMSKDGDLRLILVHKDDAEKETPVGMRSYALAFESDLSGRDQEFYEMARLVHTAASGRSIPMTVQAAGRPWVAEDLGIPAAQEI